MRIQQPPASPPPRAWRRLHGLLRRPPRWLSVTLLILVVAGASFVAGVLGERQGRLQRVDDLWQALRPSTLVNYLRSVGTEVDTLVLDIKHRHYERLAAQRQKALQRGQITDDLKEYVPGALTWQGRTMKVDLRLKGEWTDHLASDKWSFRVKIDDDQRLFGMRRFSLQHPRTRTYLEEWLYLAALRRAGITSLRYQFVRVVVNGKDLGIYALEEHFGKELIESQEGRSGLVVHFDATYRYEPRRDRQGAGPVETGIGDQQTARILTYEQARLEGDPVLARQLRQAVTLLESFRQGAIPTHQAFDSRALAWYFALSDLIGTKATADDWSDMRFLYDPVASRLAPIGVEGARYDQIRYLTGARYRQADAEPSRLHTRIFADDRFWREYVAALEAVSEPSYLAELLVDLGPDLERQRQVLHTEFPNQDLDLDRVRRNAEIIRAYLEPADGIQAWPVTLGPEEAVLEVGTIQPMPVEVLGSEWNGVRDSWAQPVLLAGRSPDTAASFQEVRVPRPASAEGAAARLRLRYRLAGRSVEWWAEVADRPRFERPLRDGDLARHAPTTDDFRFLRQEDGAWRVPAGRWTISQDLVFPLGSPVVWEAGASLDLVDGAALLIRGPLLAAGTEDDPILVESSDGTGQGVVVLEAGGRSVLQHVGFRGLHHLDRPGWQLTGATTFFRSPVEFHHCWFQGGQTEDVLNVIHSEVLLRDCTFAQAVSDAFDGDFVDARVEDCRFQDIGGDALDVSGSEVEVRRLAAFRVQDKAISVGEASALEARDVQVLDSRIGVAVKDRSSARVHQLTLRRVQFGTTVFQKKPEFGPSELWLFELAAEEVGELHLTEPGSRLFVDWIEQPADRPDLRQVLYADEDAGG